MSYVTLSACEHYSSSFDKWEESYVVQVIAKVNSMLHVLLVVPGIFIVLLFDQSFPSAEDSLFGTSLNARFLTAISCGYFIWDICHVVWYQKHVGPAFLLHAIMCLGVYLVSTLGQFMLRHSVVVLLFEISTIFVNLVFFLNEFKAPGIIQAINKGILFISFIGVRIIFGLYYTWTAVITDLIRLYNAYEVLPALTKFHFVFSASALLLANCLNIFWASLLVAKLVEMVAGGDSTNKQKEKKN
eukprot:TRINITY_DN10964_c0_g1_i1.p1 TRINITY_DN10964_c0_g1~~TRINITY_DN10964_c0_g1_i1.p1  ORF type:complete len:273 (-),score=73.44 TRINITY_DN10964_c0_g1_i1:136-864(-)